MSNAGLHRFNCMTDPMRSSNRIPIGLRSDRSNRPVWFSKLYSHVSFVLSQKKNHLLVGKILCVHISMWATDSTWMIFFLFFFYKLNDFEFAYYWFCLYFSKFIYHFFPCYRKNKKFLLIKIIHFNHLFIYQLNTLESSISPKFNVTLLFFVSRFLWSFVA